MNKKTIKTSENQNCKLFLIALVVITALLVIADIAIVYNLKRLDCKNLFESECSKSPTTNNNEIYEEDKIPEDMANQTEEDSEESNEDTITDSQYPREEINLGGNWFREKQYPQELLNSTEEAENLSCSPMYKVNPWYGLNIENWPEEPQYTYSFETEGDEYEEIQLTDERILQFIQKINKSSDPNSIYGKVNAVRECYSESSENTIIIWLTQEEEKTRWGYLTANVQYLEEPYLEAVKIPNSTMYMSCDNALAYTEDENLYLGCNAADGMWEIYEIYRVNLKSSARDFKKIESCRLTYPTMEQFNQGEDEVNVECD